MCVWQCEAKLEPMFSPVTLITQMWGWAWVEGLHGQALLYATLRKPLWVLGPHSKWLFILALITRSNPTADTVLCVWKGLECNAEVPLRKPVSLTKHYFFFFLMLCWVQWRLSRACVTGAPVEAQHHILMYAGSLLPFLSNLITIMYISATSLLLLIVAGCYNQINVKGHNDRHSCLTGHRRLLGKTQKTFKLTNRTEVDSDGDFFF